MNKIVYKVARRNLRTFGYLLALVGAFITFELGALATLEDKGAWSVFFFMIFIAIVEWIFSSTWRSIKKLRQYARSS